MKIIMYYPKRENIEGHLAEIEDVALTSPLYQHPSEEWLVLALSDFRVWSKDGTIWKAGADASIWNLNDKSKPLSTESEL